MTRIFIMPLADPNATLANVGGKGASLALLANAGLPVPDGFHVTTEAYKQFVAQNDLQARILAALSAVEVTQPTTLALASQAICDLFAHAPMPHGIADAIARAYLTLPGAGPTVAVRSSATAEDLPELSFAGQQETFLNIQGAVAVQDVVKRCWASLWTPRAIGYRAQHNVDHSAVALAVVVQMLVFADAAGILFTANPVTGARDQVVINAAWGLGEAIVGGLVTPDTLVVDKAGGRVLERDIAEKTVMTVRVDEGTEERPTPEHLRRVPVLDDEQAAELARLGALIENLYKMPMDIEWTLAENKFAIVQARPITALPEPTQPAPTEWKLPDPQAQYVRGSIVEYMPDPLSPLFRTLGGIIVDTNTRRLFSLILGRDPGSMFTTINDFAFLRVPIKFTPVATLQMLGGMLSAAPRMMRTGEQRWREDGRPRYMNTIECWEAEPLGDLSATEILTGVREILDAAIYLYTILQSGPVAVAVSSETTFTRVYDKMIKHKDDPPAATFVIGYDSAPILAEKSLFDLAGWCRPRADLATYVVNTPTSQLIAQLQSDETPVGVASDDWREWQNRFRAHLKKHGHTIYDLDFAKATPADDPTPLLDIVKMFLRGQGTNPYARQSQMAAQREQATQAMLGKLKWLRLMLFRKLVTSAQKWAPLREDSISDLGLGYPLIRLMLRELGSRFVRAGTIEQADDIFWLLENEVAQTAAALDQHRPIKSFAERILPRKSILRAEMRVTPPPGLQKRKKFMGMDIEKMGPARVSGQTGDTIQGAGTSPGKVAAPARVLRGPEEFDQMKPGEILVAVATTPAWTPLFAMASAIVTDIGGPLSHGSIVAREYGIPAVLGTGVATKRIRSGQVVTVDGSAGVVKLRID